ncbi:hypothetical protein RvY_02544 [Ramazzottius varieornatus]|uniref:Uncharacterized protein n=1 Tax=Ramazzottius varieornatus TaxID=947166 RepID=A0A1D1UQW5_RAMVA|nr:hypothetical protein RvY_02544 [Ramazzottius varieornatus]
MTRSLRKVQAFCMPAVFLNPLTPSSSPFRQRAGVKAIPGKRVIVSGHFVETLQHLHKHKDFLYQ